MFKHSSSTPRTLLIRFSLYLALVACLVWLSLWIFRGAGAPLARSQVVAATSAVEVSGGPRDALPKQMAGEQARKYLELTGEGQSLMQALTVARAAIS